VAKEAKEKELSLPLTRVQVLSDVIFATSMTIMVFTIALPDTDKVKTAAQVNEAAKALIRDAHSVTAYLLPKPTS